MSEDEGKVTEEPPPKMSYVFPNGDRYEGECTKTAVGVLMRNGTGKHISANGVVYIGAWHDDRMNGQGTLQHPSGAFYKGEFKNNMFHGMGTYTFADGTKCTGHFHENRLEGEGSFTNTQGLIWTGQFNGKTALGMKMRNDMSKAATHTPIHTA